MSGIDAAMPPASSTPSPAAPGAARGLQQVNPPGWPQPKGYANGMTGRGRLVFVAGQVGWSEAQAFATDDFVGQVEQALRNTVAVLAAAGARPDHIARMTWYVTDKREYLARLPEIGRVWRETLGRHFPAMALVQVVALLEDRAKVEIETTALVPDEKSDGVS
jgi:enamine deaminase RidA (YjgF/YER057c/UK114 family)